MTYNVRTKQSYARLRDLTIQLPAALSHYLSSGSPATSPMGMAPPTAPPVVATGGAGLLTGAYSYAVTWYDSVFDTESNPSQVSATVNPSSQVVVVDLSAIGTPPARATHARVYRNLNGTTVYRLQNTVAVASLATPYNDNTLDSALTLLLSNTNVQIAASQYGLCHQHRDIVIVGGPPTYSATTNQDAAQISKSSNPEYYPYQPLRIKRGDGQSIRAFRSQGDYLLVFKDRSITMMGWRSIPDLPPIGDLWSKQLLVGRGALNNRCVVSVDDVMFCMDADGIYMMTPGQTYREIGGPIINILRRRNMARAEMFSAVRSGPRDEVIRWFVALDGETALRYAIVLDVSSLRSERGIRWWLEERPFSVSDSCRFICGSQPGVPGMAQREVALIQIEETAEVKQLDAFLMDGVPTHLATSGEIDTIVNGGSPSLTTITQTGGGKPFSTSSISVQGCFLQGRIDSDRDWSQWYPIKSVASTTELTLGVELAGPPAWTEFRIGTITKVYDFPPATFGDPLGRKQFGDASVQYMPTPIGTNICLQVGVDDRGFSVMPAGEPEADGVSFNATRDGYLIQTARGPEPDGRGTPTSAQGSADGATHLPCGTEAGFRFRVRISGDEEQPSETVLAVRATAILDVGRV